MGLSSSLANAFSGLTITSHGAQLVSSNLANALNENYARQEIEIYRSSHGGALTSKATRFVDQALVTDRRTAKAELTAMSEKLETANAVMRAFGEPDDVSSMVASLTDFDSALRFLESNPSSTVRLNQTISSAKSIIDRLGSAQDQIQTQRMRAEQHILTEVGTLNDSLQNIVSLNEKIVSANIHGRNPNALLDQRQMLVDRVGELVPVRVLEGTHGAISLLSFNGTVLAGTKSSSFQFTKANLILPQMEEASGELSTLKLNGEVIDMSSESNGFAGGRLQALFKTRDEDAPSAQQLIDTLALDLSLRFQALPSDESATPTSVGLFTDNGAKTDPNDLSGLAGRLSLNANVDPDQGGQIWRLQSGFDATTQFPAGDASLISDMIGAMDQNQSDYGSIFDHAATISSKLAVNVSTAEQTHSFANAQYDHLNQMHLSNGVDTDAELQKLLLIEKNYAANAKVMNTIEEMFDAIMRIN